VTVVSSSGDARRVGAREQGGRWVADVALGDGDVALIRPGGVRDGFGQINDAASDVVGDGSPVARRRAAELGERVAGCR
jgi:hypothetical protein